MRGGIKVRPCAGCNRPTRPPRGRAAEYPGTVLRRHGDKCVACHGRRTPEAVDPNHLENTIAGLRHFLERRRNREAAMLRRAYYEERMLSA